MNDEGQLYVFEGVDAAGKSSVSAEFVNWLRSIGRHVEFMAFPGKASGSIGELVYRIHHDHKGLGLTSITPSSLQALHVAAHIDAIEAQILPNLRKGRTVVLDRYWWSTRVYGVVSGANAELLDKLIDAERMAWGDWLPTALFCLTRQAPLRIEPHEQWIQLRIGYEEMVNRESGQYPIHVVPNEISIEDCILTVIKNCASLT